MISSDVPVALRSEELPLSECPFRDCINKGVPVPERSRDKTHPQPVRAPCTDGVQPLRLIDRVKFFRHFIADVKAAVFAKQLSVLVIDIKKFGPAELILSRDDE